MEWKYLPALRQLWEGQRTTCSKWTHHISTTPACKLCWHTSFWQGVRLGTSFLFSSRFSGWKHSDSCLGVFYLPNRIFTLAGVNHIAPAAAAMTVLVGTALLLHGCAGFPWELSHWKPLRCTRRGGLRETLIKVPFTDALHQFISKCYIAN